MALPVSTPGRAAFWLGVPFVIAGILFRPRTSVLRVGFEPFSLELNGVDGSWLPWPLANVWFFYPATVVALVILRFFLLWRRHAATAGPSLSLAAFFLPTCVAGIESVQLLGWSLRCHNITEPTDPIEIVASGAVLSGAALLATIVAGALAARACGHRSRLGLPFTAVPVAVVAQVMMQWWLLGFLYGGLRRTP